MQESNLRLMLPKHE